VNETLNVGATPRHTGLRPRTSRPGQARFATLPQAGIDILPRDKWLPLDLSRADPSPMDQDGRNACASFAAVQAFHLARQAAGLPFHILSPGSLYARVNGGSDQGSSLEDNLQELLDRGVSTAAAVPILAWRMRDLPTNWQTEAANNKITEAWDCPTFDALATALTRGDPVAFGINVGNSFEPAADGWIPYHRGSAGHGLAGEALCCKPKPGTRWATIPATAPEHLDALPEAIAQDAVHWGIRTPNSWADWGLLDSRGKRYGIIPEAYFTTSPFNDGWAIRVVTQTQSVRQQKELAHA